MPENNRGMGRGLAALLGAAPRDGTEEFRQVPLELIDANPRQPRRALDDDALLVLAESIRARGVIQPVLVRPLADGRYELVAGERRWRAARLADLATIPALVRPHDDAQSLELAVIENMAREDLNPVEEARACMALVEELGLTREEVGLRVGRSRVAVSNVMRLLDLPDEALALLERRELSEGHGRALLLAADNAVRRVLARRAAAQGWSVRELEARARAADNAGGSAHPDGEVREERSDMATGLHPDQLDLGERIADALAGALGVDVKVRAGVRGYVVRLSFATPDEAFALAERLERGRAQPLA